MISIEPAEIDKVTALLVDIEQCDQNYRLLNNNSKAFLTDLVRRKYDLISKNSRIIDFIASLDN